MAVSVRSLSFAASLRRGSAPATVSSAVPVSRSATRVASSPRAGASRCSARRAQAPLTSGTPTPAASRPTARAAPASGSSQAVNATDPVPTRTAVPTGSSQRSQ